MLYLGASVFLTDVRKFITVHSAPAAPELDYKTADSIKVKTVLGIEYSIDKTNWNVSGLFTDLSENTEYELFIESPAGLKSYVRLLKTSPIPEGTTVINYMHPEDTQYDFSGYCLCSPSLVRLESGRLLAGMDLFLSEHTGVTCTIADDPDSCVAYGCGKSLGWINLMTEGPINIARKRIMRQG